MGPRLVRLHGRRLDGLYHHGSAGPSEFAGACADSCADRDADSRAGPCPSSHACPAAGCDAGSSSDGSAGARGGACRHRCAGPGDPS